MFASKIKLSENVSHQKSSTGKVLEWMQKNPQHCKNTNASVMAKTMSMDGMGLENALRQTIQKMVNNQMVGRVGNKRHSNFYINYLHKDIPPYVVENATDEIRKTRQDIEKGLDEGQYLDDVGCVVTKPKEEEPKEDEESPKLGEPIEQFTTVPVRLHQEKTNGSISLSITLNLNLNLNLNN